jgi:DNA primase
MDPTGGLTYSVASHASPRPMTLPPGFLDELRTRVSIAQVVGRKVAWDARKSNPGKGDFWAPCPFHQEKSASFHVDDRKGFYYCFGCHAKGDALSFLRETQNLGFMEAVEQLAREAGMTLPARDPGERQVADRRERLVAVCEAAAKFWRAQLSGAAATAARAYLDRRGLSAAGRERFGLGFAVDSRRVLWDHLTGAGFDADLIVEAGLCARPEGGGPPYDRFRDRIIFPIRDSRGRTIAFGGRAMAQDARAKYLNSPETPLFDKGRNLYNLGPAREALAKTGPLIVAEGYMDVIALDQAGFRAAVAPLGTAITEDQLRLMWRLDPEPVIALDGDTAGLRAGHRLADLALGLIGAGQSLRFAILPAGQDPDDLIRAGGPAAMQAVLDRAQPMARLIWERETSGQVFDGPERRAALDRRLKALAGRIQDPSLRDEYAREFRQLREGLFGQRSGTGREWQPSARGAKGARKAPVPAAPLPVTRSTRLANGNATSGEDLREARVLAILAARPDQLTLFEGALWAMDPEAPDHRALHSALMDAVRAQPAPDREALDRASGGALGRVLARPDVAISPLLREGAEAEMLTNCLAEDFARLAADRAALRETAEAMADLEHLPDEGLTWRLRQASAARDKAGRGSSDSGAGSDDDDSRLSAELQSLIDGQVWVKRRGGPK